MSDTNHTMKLAQIIYLAILATTSVVFAPVAAKSPRVGSCAEPCVTSKQTLKCPKGSSPSKNTSAGCWECCYE
ncbi:uncharacterized protein EDB93DRAFT_1138377 [Suillus bovinus]|uniref:uncharacterized protein n=1 Tax=Suillus bovinus TaxID=48563 RepID=UPI001B885945|nr:uncharacterized protein EDB93DRAFT_1138377 [Suillus bovinus]KAG2151599.1 hypothetical protein EDB93DRAFT_1138377 [Suillus bovinus]